MHLLGNIIYYFFYIAYSGGNNVDIRRVQKKVSVVDSVCIQYNNI